MAAVDGSSINFFSKNEATGWWETSSSLRLPGTITALDFSPNDKTITAIVASSSNIVFLEKNTLKKWYEIGQTVNTGASQPQTVAYVGVG